MMMEVKMEAPSPIQTGAKPKFNTAAPVFNPTAPSFTPQQPKFNPAAPAFAPQQPMYRSSAPIFTPQQPMYKSPQSVFPPPQMDYGAVLQQQQQLLFHEQQLAQARTYMARVQGEKNGLDAEVARVGIKVRSLNQELLDLNSQNDNMTCMLADARAKLAEQEHNHASVMQKTSKLRQLEMAGMHDASKMSVHIEHLKKTNSSLSTEKEELKQQKVHLVQEKHRLTQQVAAQRAENVRSGENELQRLKVAKDMIANDTEQALRDLNAAHQETLAKEVARYDAELTKLQQHHQDLIAATHKRIAESSAAEIAKLQAEGFAALQKQREVIVLRQRSEVFARHKLSDTQQANYLERLHLQL
jgi:chromosome segregation ATPase